MVSINREQIKKEKTKSLGSLVLDYSTNISQQETITVDRRVTGRTQKLATQVTPTFKRLLKQLAFEQDCMIVEVIERAVHAYAKQLSTTKTNLVK